MPDFATLGFNIDKTPVDQASASLDKMGVAGASAGAKAQAGLDRTTRAIKELQAAYRTGAIGFAQGLPELKKLEEQAAGYRAAIDRLPAAHQRAGISINALRSPLATLATQALGTSGSLGQLGSVLLSLSGGSVLAIGVTAGIAAIAAGLHALGSAARAEHESIEKINEALAKMQESSLGAAKALVGQAGEIVATLTPKLNDAKRALDAAIGTGDAEAIARTNNQYRDLKDRLDEATTALTRARGAYQGVRDDAIKAYEAANKITKAPVIDWADGVAASIRDIDFAIKDVLSGGDRLGRNLGALLDPTLVTGTGNVLDNPGPERVAETAKIAEHWQSASQSVANIVTLLANADSATAQWLGNVVGLVGQLEDASKEIAKVGSLSATSTVGLIAGGISLLSGAFGETEGQRRYREAVESNSDALRHLDKSLNNSALGITGNQFTTAGGGVAALLASNAGQNITNRTLNVSAVQAILGGAGTNLADLKEFAKQLGITLSTDTPARFIESLHQLQKAMQETALVTLKDFAGQLDLINRQWALGGVTDPLKKLADLLKLATGSQGAPGLSPLGNFDLSQGAGRSAALNFLQGQLGRAQNGTLTTAELGGLTVQQYLDFLSQFGALLNEANQAIQSTIDNLSAFADSLKLDQSLTTLSPAQQLAEARRQYEDVLKAAQAGDLSAANRLPDVARQFLSASRSFNASSPAYAADFARVLADTEAVQKLLGAAEDGWKAVEKPLVNVVDNTQKIYEAQQTTNEVLRVGLLELGAKVDDLRSEMRNQVQSTKYGFEGGKA